MDAMKGLIRQISTAVSFFSTTVKSHGRLFPIADEVHPIVLTYSVEITGRASREYWEEISYNDWMCQSTQRNPCTPKKLPQMAL